MARISLSVCFAALLLLPGAADAKQDRAHPGYHRTSAQRTQAGRAASIARAAVDPGGLAMTLAVRHWGTAPCGGEIQVHTDRPLAAGIDATTDAWVTFESALGPNNLSAPAGTYTGCTISLASWQWPTREREVADWNMFCLTVVHEMGHLLGHPHSLIPGSVMAAVFTDESSVPAICRSARGRVETGALPAHATVGRKTRRTS
jgi:hypothetical protein